MLVPEYAIPQSQSVTVKCYGKEEVWEDREQAKDFYLEGMMNSDGSEHDRYTSIYLQIMNGLNYCTDE